MKEASQKDVEQAFGVLQAQFAVVAMPARGWDPLNLHLIMKTSVILNNMIVEDTSDHGEEIEY